MKLAWQGGGSGTAAHFGLHSAFVKQILRPPPAPNCQERLPSASETGGEGYIMKRITILFSKRSILVLHK